MKNVQKKWNKYNVTWNERIEKKKINKIFKNENYNFLNC